MASPGRPTTPPPARQPGNLPKAPLTPEQVRQLEINRLKAKALREQNDAAIAATAATAGQKRSRSDVDATASSSSASSRPATRARTQNHRDGTSATAGMTAGTGALSTPADNAAYIKPARNFAKSSYIEYDLSTMTDTKGGFLSAADDPHNRALHAGSGSSGNDRDGSGGGAEQKPAHMTLAEWERHQLLKKLRAAKAGPFEPGISVLDSTNSGDALVCQECARSRELDWQLHGAFGVAVCHGCREAHPEKYSLLTKTEAREDYLLTDPELRDEALLPRLEKPNPRSSTFHAMQLFLRCQLEAYALGPRRWGSAAALDEEFAKREREKRERKEKRFQSKLDDLKKRTRVEAYRRSRQAGAAVGDGIGGGGGGSGSAGGGSGKVAQFGDRVKGRFDRHEHEWGRAVEDPETGLTKKRCMECGMEVEELEF